MSGSKADDDELTTAEALDVVHQLARLGVSVVTLTGGEPLLRDDWLALAEAVRRRGMGLRFSANGQGFDKATLASLVELGTESFAVSIDGAAVTHDELRQRQTKNQPSPFVEALKALDLLRETPIRSGVITTVFRENLAELPQIHALLKAHGAQHWMVQLAHRTGRLRGEGRSSPSGGYQPLAPEDLPKLAVFLVRAGRERTPRLIVHNTIGYLSREEPLLPRSGAARRLGFWSGCGCGKSTIGIAPNGDVKGCANQIGEPFVTGNIRTEPLRTIWRDRSRWHWVAPEQGQLGGECTNCALSHICRAGCTALAFSATGDLFDNPYCLRALERKAKGG